MPLLEPESGDRGTSGSLVHRCGHGRGKSAPNSLRESPLPVVDKGCKRHRDVIWFCLPTPLYCPKARALPVPCIPAVVVGEPNWSWSWSPGKGKVGGGGVKRELPVSSQLHSPHRSHFSHLGPSPTWVTSPTWENRASRSLVGSSVHSHWACSWPAALYLGRQPRGADLAQEHG